jgi:hypothetical protein
MKKPDHRCKLVNWFKNKLKFIAFTHVGRYLKYSNAIMNVALLVAWKNILRKTSIVAKLNLWCSILYLFFPFLAFYTLLLLSQSFARNSLHTIHLLFLSLPAPFFISPSVPFFTNICRLSLPFHSSHLSLLFYPLSSWVLSYFSIFSFLCTCTCIAGYVLWGGGVIHGSQSEILYSKPWIVYDMVRSGWRCYLASIWAWEPPHPLCGNPPTWNVMVIRQSNRIAYLPGSVGLGGRGRSSDTQEHLFWALVPSVTFLRSNRGLPGFGWHSLCE